MKRRSERTQLEWANAQEEVHQQLRTSLGIDPDEDTIYNVLCPQIRKTWTRRMENLRRASAYRSACVEMDKPQEFIGGRSLHS